MVDKKFCAKDYEQTFEAQGMEFVYEFLLYTYYMPPCSLSIIKKGIVKEFMHNETIRKMEAEGLRLTLEDAHKMILSMDTAVSESRSKSSSLLSGNLTEQKINELLALAGAVAKAYYLFDPHFFDSLFDKSQHDSSAKKIVAILEEYKNKAREEFNKIFFGDGLIPSLLSQMSKKTGISREDLGYYDEKELIALINGRHLSSQIISDRKEAFVVIKDVSSKISFLIGKEAIDFAESFFEGENIFKKKEITGRGAHATGKIITGKARVITRDYGNINSMRDKMSEMKKGEILITQTTDPEMMPALRKASAVVTDIGGMLSHTAIVARELNIPCIVNTKNATQLFKNGDLIEVDANQGIVKKI